MLISIEGDYGSGKTLLATFLALKDRRKVMANYTINIPNFVPLKPEMLWNINEPTLIVLDEAYAWLESRTSGKPINRYLSYNLFQSRKRGGPEGIVDYILTDQLIGTVDPRYRMMINFDIQAEPHESGFVYTMTKLTRRGASKPATFFIPFSLAAKIFPYYNTYQKVDPIDKELLFSISEDQSDIMKQVDIVRDELLDKYVNLKKITKGVVRDYCLRNGHPKMFVDRIYDAIKSVQLECESEAG